MGNQLEYVYTRGYRGRVKGLPLPSARRTVSTKQKPPNWISTVSKQVLSNESINRIF